MDEPDRREIFGELREVVSMAPSELERWLETEDSLGVGWHHEGEDEAVGRKSGRRIVDIVRTKKADLTDDDYGQMRKVIGYVRRHSAQGGPADGVEHSRRRYSLMNWGHDPL